MIDIDGNLDETEHGWWNYRVIVKTLHSPPLEDELSFGIHQVFYDSEGNINSFTSTPSFPIGETENGLKTSIALMMSAFTRPVICYNNIKHLKG
jgi:hypothetical protein